MATFWSQVFVVYNGGARACVSEPTLSCSVWCGNQPQMARQKAYDVAVVGAGIMGSCVAHRLAAQGHSVLLLEQFDLLHSRGSSHGHSRIIRRTYPEPHYAKMMERAYQLWDHAEKEAGFGVIIV